MGRTRQGLVSLSRFNDACNDAGATVGEFNDAADRVVDHHP